MPMSLQVPQGAKALKQAGDSCATGWQKVRLFKQPVFPLARITLAVINRNQQSLTQSCPEGSKVGQRAPEPHTANNALVIQLNQLLS